MNKKTYSAILDGVAREYIPDDVDLAPRILAQIQERKRTPMKLHVKLLMAAIVALLVLIVVLVRVPSVAEAMQRMLDRFIPGIGIIEISEACALADPVSVTRDGITVRVEQLVADSQHTVLVYTVNGLPKLSEPILEGTYSCSGEPRLRLSTGAEILYSESEPSMDVSAQGDVEFHATYQFPELPVDARNVTFVLPCLLQGSNNGDLPKNWEIPLTLVPVLPEMTTYPVIEVVSTSPIDLSTHVPTAAVAQNFSLTVDRVVPMKKSFRLYARLSEEEDLLRLDKISSAHLLDINDQPIPGMDGSSDQTSGLDCLSFTFDAKTEYPSTPVTLVVEAVDAQIFLDDANRDFVTFDMGQHPQIDQEWELNQDIQIGDYSLHFETARLYKLNGEYSFAFQMISPGSAVHSAILFDADDTHKQHPTTTMWLNGDRRLIESDVIYEPGFIPSGTVTIGVHSFFVTLNGPWQTTLTLPLPEETPNP